MNARTIGLVALLVVIGLLLIGCAAAPQPRHDHGPTLQIQQSARLVHDGTCEVTALGIGIGRCRGFVDDAAELLWVVFYGRDTWPTAVVRISLEDEVPRIAWCRRGFCGVDS